MLVRFRRFNQARLKIGQEPASRSNLSSEDEPRKLGVRNFLQSTKRLFQVAQKPDWQEVSLLIKITAIGVLLIGFTGFIIRILFWLVGLYQIPTNVQPTTTG